MSINPIIENLYLTQVLQENPLSVDSLYLSFQPALLSSLAKEFGTLISSLHYDFIYPSEPFSIPLATHISLLYNIPLFLSFSESAFLKNGQTALVLDISSSFSSRLERCIEECKPRGISICDALILLEPTPEEKVTSQKTGIKLHSLWDIKNLQNDLNTILHQNSYSKIH